jgi:hypothetical protein
MNDQIKALMGQTLDEKFAGTWSTMDMQDLTKFAERFAELIVAECLTQVDKVDAMLDDPKEKVGVSWVGLAIAKHWGIE